MNSPTKEEPDRVTSPKPKGKAKLTKNAIAIATKVQTPLTALVGNDKQRITQLSDLLDAVKSQHAIALDTRDTFLAASIRCGSYLLQLKALAGHGNWIATFNTLFAPQLGFGERTMQRYLCERARFTKWVSSLEQAEQAVLDEPSLISAYCKHLQKSSEGTDRLDRKSAELLAPKAITTIVNQYLSSGSSESFMTQLNSDESNAGPHRQGLSFVAPGTKVDLGALTLEALAQLRTGQMDQLFLLAPIAQIAEVEPLLDFPIAILKGDLPASRAVANEEEQFEYVALPPMGLVLIAHKPNLELLGKCLEGLGVVFLPAKLTKNDVDDVFASQS